MAYIMHSRKCKSTSADTLGDIIDYAISKKMRIETFSKAARLKAPVYYTGEGDNMFRVNAQW